MERGKRGAQRMGVWLQQQGLLPDYIVSSPAVRAIETANKLCKAMGMDVQQIKQEPQIYEAGVGSLLEVLGRCPKKARRVLIVGHNPGFENLVAYLGGEGVSTPPDGKLMPTAALARLQMPDSWKTLSAGCARLITIQRAKALPERFPFPDYRGEALRERPAYYYTQSSVIPYRLSAGRVEILLIRSSRLKHWIVPKGVSDPGLTLQESAAKEAFEEAGIEGEVGSLPLGSYTIRKWGAECTVHVYPMAVSRELPESKWEESYRGREWLSAEQAAKRITKKELRPIIEKLVKQLEKQ
jgi:phosphohistidine phosphatase